MKQNRLLEDDDITYEDVDDDGEVVNGRTYNKAINPARVGKTDFQKRALNSVHQVQFSDVAQHKAFRKVEDLSIGATDQSYLASKWIDNCISFWTTVNTGKTKWKCRSLDNLISWMSDDTKRMKWIQQNQQRLLDARKEEGRAMINAALNVASIKQAKMEDPDGVRL